MKYLCKTVVGRECSIYCKIKIINIIIAGI